MKPFRCCSKAWRIMEVMYLRARKVVDVTDSVALHFHPDFTVHVLWRLCISLNLGDEPFLKDLDHSQSWESLPWLCAPSQVHLSGQNCQEGLVLGVHPLPGMCLNGTCLQHNRFCGRKWSRYELLGANMRPGQRVQGVKRNTDLALCQWRPILRLFSKSRVSPLPLLGMGKTDRPLALGIIA